LEGDLRRLDLITIALIVSLVAAGGVVEARAQSAKQLPNDFEGSVKPLTIAVKSEQDSLIIPLDENLVIVDAHGESRREILDRLLAGRNVELHWMNAAMAAEPVVGRFKAQKDKAALRVLQELNYIWHIPGHASTSRVSHLYILEKTSSAPTPSPPQTSAPPAPAPEPRPESGQQDGKPQRREPSSTERRG
jgi:hypothetical protein